MYLNIVINMWNIYCRLTISVKKILLHFEIFVRQISLNKLWTIIRSQFWSKIMRNLCWRHYFPAKVRIYLFMELHFFLRKGPVFISKTLNWSNPRSDNWQMIHDNNTFELQNIFEIQSKRCIKERASKIKQLKNSSYV